MERRHTNLFDTAGNIVVKEEELVPLPPNLHDPLASAVRAELQRVLASHHFETSKRCQAFLRYTVEQTLAGRGELKERVIGMEVFDRTPSYDTNQDPVVRMTAGEVRKRLALYYQGEEFHSDVRLELPVGVYVPRFSTGWANEAGPLASSQLLPALTLEPLGTRPLNVPDQSAPSLVVPPGRRSVLRPALIALSLLLLAILTALPFLRHHLWPQETAMDRFWEPVLASDDPVLISIGQIWPALAQVQPNHQRSSLAGEMMLGSSKAFPRQIAVTVLGDSMTMANVAALLKARNKPYSIRPQSSTNYADLQANSTVLIGAFNNDWTINLTNNLRFHFATDAGNAAIWIADREHPEARIGFLPPGSSVAEMKADYGVVVRMYDQQTKKRVVIVGGLTPLGTQAGGELLTNPAYLAEYARSAPPDWASRNMEIVYKTDLIDGEISPPQIVSACFW